MNELTLLGVDFETYFDTEYTLRKMSTLEYVRDPRFKVLGAAIKIDDQPPRWIPGSALTDFFNAVDWARTATVAHNSSFDNLVLYEHYQKSPAQRIDSLGLARALLPADIDFDLDTLGVLLGLGGKLDGGKALQAVKGIRDLEESDPRLIALGEYACIDIQRAYDIYKILWPHLPETERRLMNLTVRLSTEGRLLFDQTLSTEALKEAQDARKARIENGGVDLAILNSDNKFAELLRSRNVEPPTKISARTGKTAWAFSKSDPQFLALLENPDVAAVVDARMAAKSTSEIKRIERLRQITALPPHTLPMPLNYCGAHTHRWSGGGKINPQNFKKGPGGKPGKLRRSIHAPDGYVLVVADSAQIELRFNLWWCGQNDLLSMLAAGEDLYGYMASSILRKPINKKDNPNERNFGKVVELGCGYGMGAPKFRATCAIGPMGVAPIHLTDVEAANAVMTYRTTHPHVKQTWDWLGYQAIPVMTGLSPVERGPLRFEKERIIMPSGLELLYPDLRMTEDGWVYGTNGVMHRLYGGLLLENCIQSLARDVVAEQMDLIDREVAPVVTMTHDEIVCLAPESRAKDVYESMIEIMSTTPSWAPGLPLAAEGGFAQEYSK